ncbi:hypothetical protein FUA23_00815 [Neolewinella aurantiaca]|uniref:Uncharacterized protein n=1 Tax=Neolewinella aurantiaca TaxID=2602767 RepID=A0A5C7FKA5_9BACT|nr:hypothetical protein [Neolewinella aurantiaca]TXF91759.1 hypothetical protein FUA23_00815 [Neolewinella aurantiaca]
MLPALLFSMFFLLPTWWLWRGELRAWAAVPFLTCLILLGFTLGIKLDDTNHKQAIADAEVLLDQLRIADIYVANDLTNKDELLLLTSLGSQALYRTAAYIPERKGAVDSTLYIMAAWVADRSNLRQWQRNANWDREAYFLAHAGATLGHYQLVTNDLTFEQAFKNIGEHLGKRLQRGRYKHLLSRPGEDFFRPADNAAALYTLSLFDQLYGTNYTKANYNDWATYLKDELYYAESRLPCSAFSATNRCTLEPTASATGLYIAYRAAAYPEDNKNDIPWREWLHYFGKTSMSPFSMGIRSNMRKGETPRFCDQTAYPLDCDRYEEAVGLWAASEYNGNYTYFRLYAANAMQRWFFSPVNYSAMRAPRRIGELTRVAIRAIGCSPGGVKN